MIQILFTPPTRQTSFATPQQPPPYLPPLTRASRLAHEQLDSYLLKFSAGALALSLSPTTGLFENSNAARRCLLVLAWLLYLVTIGATLWSFRASAKSCDEMVEIAYDAIVEGHEGATERHRKALASTRALNTVSIGSFLAALLPNLPLRGLFWLGKDLFEDREGFQEAMEPDARELNTIRNHLEHKYLKLHDDLWPGPDETRPEILRGLSDTLAFSLYSSDFEKRALKLLKMARAALIYLSLRVHTEERRRRSEMDGNTIIPSMPLDLWEDDWKR